jgi:hypothetical protein
MTRARGSLAEALATSAGSGGATVRVGVLVDIAGGAPWVELPGGGRIRARSMIPLDRAALASGGGRREVVLLFEGGDPARPIVAGFLEPEVATPALDAVLAAAPDGDRAVPEIAEVDGRRVVLDGKDEVVLRCGKASITLRRNGKIVLRGAYVETHADGTNRIKGGTVKIN